jgi:hypothetical protein
MNEPSTLGTILGAALRARDEQPKTKGYAWHPHYDVTITVRVSHSDLANMCEDLLGIARDKVHRPKLRVVYSRKRKT